MALQPKVVVGGGGGWFLGECMLEHLSFKGYSFTVPKRKLSKQAFVCL